MLALRWRAGQTDTKLTPEHPQNGRYSYYDAAADGHGYQKVRTAQFDTRT